MYLYLVRTFVGPESNNVDNYKRETPQDVPHDTAVRSLCGMVSFAF